MKTFNFNSLKQSTWRDMAVLFGISILLRGALLAFGFYQQDAEAFLSMPGDSTNYINAAIAILAGEGDYQRTFFAYGPGYPLALSAQMWVFGVSSVPLMIVNVIISSLACLLIYKITLLFGFNRMVALIGGLAAAVSPTAISLSCILLSDTTYLFLLAVVLTLFLSGLAENHRFKIIFAGAILSYAILARSLGQMMPLALLILFLISPLKESLKPNGAKQFYKSRWVSVSLCLALPFLTMSIWMAHNHSVNGHRVLSFTSVGAPARVAALTLEELTGVSERIVRSDKVDMYQMDNGLDSMSLPDIFNAYKQLLDETWRDYPWEMIIKYFKIDWNNWNQTTSLHHFVVPQSKQSFVPIEVFVTKKGLNYLPVIVAFFGFYILIRRKQYRTALGIAVIYFYYALLIGFYNNQGSRYFLPAQVVEAALFGLVVTSIWPSVALQLKKLRAKMYAYK